MEEGRKRKRKRKTSQNCKIPMERLITTIKNVTEKNKFKSLTRFYSANNIDNYNRGKIQENLQSK